MGTKEQLVQVSVKIAAASATACGHNCPFLISKGNGSMAYPMSYQCSLFHESLIFKVGRPDIVVRTADCRGLSR